VPRRAKIGAVSERANGDEELDARWADIVANWDDPAPPSHDDLDRPRAFDAPAADPGPEPSDSAFGSGTASGASPAYRGVPEAAEGVDAGRNDPIEAGWRAYEPPADDEHWSPPDPEPLPPSQDLGFWIPTVGLGGGVCLLLFAVLIRPDNAGWYAGLALAGMVVGFVTMLRRGGGSSPEDNFGIRL